MIIERFLPDDQSRVWFQYYEESSEVVILGRYMKYFLDKLTVLNFHTLRIDTDEELQVKSMLHYLTTIDASKIETLELLNLGVPLTDITSFLANCYLPMLKTIILDDYMYKYNLDELRLFRLLTGLPNLGLLIWNEETVPII